MFDRIKKFWHDHDEAIVTGAISATTIAVSSAVIATYRIKQHKIKSIDVYCDAPEDVAHDHHPLTVVVTTNDGVTHGGQTNWLGSNSDHTDSRLPIVDVMPSQIPPAPVVSE